MKKLFTIVLVLMLSLMVVGGVFAGSGISQFKSARLDYSGTGWGGWSCPPSHPFILGAKVVHAETGEVVEPSTLLHSLAWKPGASVNGTTYPNTPWGYTYGSWYAGETGWIVQNNTKEGRSLFIILTCREPYEVCDKSVIGRVVVREGEWSEFEWDAGRGLYVSTRTVVTVTIYVDARDKETECSRDRDVTVEERTRGPDEVLVGVSLRCSTPDEDGTCWQLMGGVTVEPAGAAILTLDGIDYTASQGLHADFGTHEWSAVANESFTIPGDDHGTITITESECNVPFIHLPTGPSGQPINLPLVILIGLIGVSALSVGVVVVKRSRL